MPTKNEQADLLQVMFGRNGDSPMPIVAPATPGECFDLAIEACRLALKYMTPVVFLSDAFLATGSEPWRIPSLGRPRPDRRRQRHRPGDLPPVPARPRHAGASVGGPGHARSRAPDRWPREGRHHRQRQLRPGQPPPDADAARGQGRRDRRRYPAARGLRARARRPAHPRLGLDLRRDPVRRRAPDGRRPLGRPRPSSSSQSRSRPTPSMSSGATDGCSSRRSTSASCSC